MTCAGCPHSKLAEMLRSLRKAGFSVHREIRSCTGCAAETKALEEAKARGAAALVFWDSEEAMRVALELQRREQAAKAGKVIRTPIVLWVSHRTLEGDAAATAQSVVDAAVAEGLSSSWSGDVTAPVAVFL